MKMHPDAEPSGSATREIFITRGTGKQIDKLAWHIEDKANGYRQAEIQLHRWCSVCGATCVPES